jgi:hypothetical protein
MERLLRRNDSGTLAPARVLKQGGFRRDEKGGVETHISTACRKFLCYKVRKRALHFMKCLSSEVNVNVVLYSAVQRPACRMIAARSISRLSWNITFFAPRKSSRPFIAAERL